MGYTEKWHYTIIDAPGHRDFIKNMITGASQSDSALVMVPADGNFTTAIAKGNHKAGEIQGQTRQHSRLINLLGVKQICIGVNKMDWWKGMDIEYGKEVIHCDTAYDVLDKLCRVPERPTSAPMRMPISGIYKIKGVGDVLAGRVEQGIVKPGEE